MVHPCLGLSQASKELSPSRLVKLVLQQAAIPIRRCLPLARGEVHVDLEPAPGWMLLVQEVARRQAKTLGEVRERDHRGSRDAGLERADIRLRVSIAGQLLLREPGPSASFPDALADPLRERGVMCRRARGGARAGHGRSVHALASVT